jgi:hypothetical protein
MGQDYLALLQFFLNHRRLEFTVKPGELLDLGDIVIEKPQSP